MQIVFGTDGVRDIANKELSSEVAFLVARAGVGTLLEMFYEGDGRKSVVVGMDTRISSSMLEAAVSSAVASLGIDVLRAYVVPTPAVARLVIEHKAICGIVISASHNPMEYNGIKFFDKDGFKLADSIEREIEKNIVKIIEKKDRFKRPTGKDVGRLIDLKNAKESYVKHVIDKCRCDLSGIHIVLDCANGSASYTSKEAFEALGARVTEIFFEPDGLNINDGCGSTYMNHLCSKVLECKADLGLAHDGDADRVLAADENGVEVDGDEIMAIIAKSEGIKELVATNYSNLGFIRAVESEGGTVIMADSGDRYVLDEMKKRGIRLGGEKSGHVIFLDRSTTGDGLVTGIELVKALVEAKKPLSELRKIMTHYPQKMINVKVSDKSKYNGNKVIINAIEEAEKELASDGRVFVRPSGTESLIRVMVEAKDELLLDKTLDRLVCVVKEELA